MAVKDNRRRRQRKKECVECLVLDHNDYRKKAIKQLLCVWCLIFDWFKFPQTFQQKWNSTTTTQVLLYPRHHQTDKINSRIVQLKPFDNWTEKIQVIEMIFFHDILNIRRRFQFLNSTLSHPVIDCNLFLCFTFFDGKRNEESAMYTGVKISILSVQWFTG